MGARAELITPKMKIFQEIQQNFLVVGISPYQSSRKNPFIVNILITLLGSIFSAASYFLWLFHMAISFNEYVDAMFYIFGAAITTIGFSILIWKTKNWFWFIENLETFINESKLSKTWRNIKIIEVGYNFKVFTKLKDHWTLHQKSDSKVWVMKLKNGADL